MAAGCCLHRQGCRHPWCRSGALGHVMHTFLHIGWFVEPQGIFALIDRRQKSASVLY